MPMFFFISGFLAYKTLNKEGVNYGNELSKKVRILLIPTFVFGIIYSFYIDKDLLQSLVETEKTGYWFTLVSFYMYFIVFNALRLCGLKGKTWIYIMVTIAMLLTLLKFPMKMIPSLCEIGNITSFHYLFEFFQYFVFGMLASKFVERFHMVIDTNWMPTIAIPMFAILLCIKNSLSPIGTLDILIEKAIELVLAYLGIIIVYAFFRKYQETFMSSSRIGAFLSYIGRRTLDIYMLHYFFLPRLPELGAWLKSYPNVTIEIVLVLLLSFVVVGISLTTSSIIRVSDTLAYYLFGKRKTV
jgi:fucose 4-O-acetylase-like acetyltransferase